MKQVYQCEYCDEILENRDEMSKHEKKCGRNPKNRIDNETVIKLSRIYGHFTDSLIYVILNDFSEEKIKFYDNEFERATNNNCPASIYENKRKIHNVFVSVDYFRRNETNYFNKITKRDNPELIEAIRTFLREPEYRIKKK